MQHPTKIFSTSDIYLSAALKIAGLKLLSVNRDQDGRGIFRFEDREDRSDLVQRFFSEELTGSLKRYASAWIDLRSYVSQVTREGK